MAGIAAEKSIYSGSEGGTEDLQKLRGVLFLAGKQQQEIVNQENLATLQAKTLIKDRWAAYQALVIAMSNRAAIADCCHQIDLNQVKVENWWHKYARPLEFKLFLVLFQQDLDRNASSPFAYSSLPIIQYTESRANRSIADNC